MTPVTWTGGELRFGRSIFLAGSFDLELWHFSAIKLLQNAKYFDQIWIPASQDDNALTEEEQLDWAFRAADRATMLLFWDPGGPADLQFGYYAARRPAACVLGHPISAPHTKYLDELARRCYIPVTTTLEDAVRVTLDHLE